MAYTTTYGQNLQNLDTYLRRGFAQDEPKTYGDLALLGGGVGAGLGGYTAYRRVAPIRRSLGATALQYEQVLDRADNIYKTPLQRLFEPKIYSELADKFPAGTTLSDFGEDANLHKLKEVVDRVAAETGQDPKSFTRSFVNTADEQVRLQKEVAPRILTKAKGLQRKIRLKYLKYSPMALIPLGIGLGVKIALDKAAKQQAAKYMDPFSANLPDIPDKLP